MCTASHFRESPPEACATDQQCTCSNQCTDCNASVQGAVAATWIRFCTFLFSPQRLRFFLKEQKHAAPCSFCCAHNQHRERDKGCTLQHQVDLAANNVHAATEEHAAARHTCTNALVPLLFPKKSFSFFTTRSERRRKNPERTATFAHVFNHVRLH